MISVHKIAANPIPGRELESSKHRRARAMRSLARNWLRAAKSGWLTHSGKRRTSRALRLLRRHHRSEAPCMAPKQSTRPRTAAQPNDAEKKVQCGTCNSDSWIFAHKWTPGRTCRFCCSPFPKPVARAQSVGKRAEVDAGSAPAGVVEPWLREILQEKLDVIGIFPMVFMLVRSLRMCLILPIFGLMVVWCWIRSLVFLLLVLGCLLTSLSSAGMVAGGAMLIVFKLLVLIILVGLLFLFLVLCRLFRGLSFGGHSCSSV